MPARQEDARRMLGTWYTPPAVVDLALSLAEVTPGRRLRVLDPTCGDGAFLARARERVAEPKTLVGIDVDEAATRAAAARVPEASITCADLFSLPAEAIEPADAVVGNPPYVRQERLPASTKARIRARLAADFPDAPAALFDRLTGRGDLAVACAARCLRLVRPGGRIALVVSSALLDAGYARPLWELVDRVARVDAVVDAPRERWFPDAAVNAVIVALEVHVVPARARARPPVTIARLGETTQVAASKMRSRRDLSRVSEIREVPADAPDRWAAALRGSDAWLDFEGAAGGALVSLGALAALRRGITSGANDVFYLSRERAAELGIERELLVPLLRAPKRRGAVPIAVDPAATSHVALVAPPTAEELAKFPAAERYLRARVDAAGRPSLRHRRPWWALPVVPAQLFFTKAYASRFVQQVAPAKVVADQRVYSVHPRPGVSLELLAAILNASFTALAIESLGRASMGEGALEWTVAGAESLPVLDPRRLSQPAARRVLEAFGALTRRPIGSAAEERGRDDRVDLDRAVAAAGGRALARHVGAVQEALAVAVARRARRAQSGRVKPALAAVDA